MYGKECLWDWAMKIEQEPRTTLRIRWALDYQNIIWIFDFIGIIYEYELHYPKSFIALIYDINVDKINLDWHNFSQV